MLPEKNGFAAPQTNPARGEGPATASWPPHPGQVLREQFLKPLQMPAEMLARMLQLPAAEVDDILCERCDLSAKAAVRLAKCFHTPEDFWIELQMAYDAAQVRRLYTKRIAELTVADLDDKKAA